MRFEKLVTSS